MATTRKTIWNAATIRIWAGVSRVKANCTFWRAWASTRKAAEEAPRATRAINQSKTRRKYGGDAIAATCCGRGALPGIKSAATAARRSAKRYYPSLVRSASKCYRTRTTWKCTWASMTALTISVPSAATRPSRATPSANIWPTAISLARADLSDLGNLPPNADEAEVSHFLL